MNKLKEIIDKELKNIILSINIKNNVLNSKK